MDRTWPFDQQDEEEKFRTPNDLVARREGCEAVVIRIGLHDAQLVLVDGDGAWDRWVYHSESEATGVANSLGVPVHVGEYPEQLRVRINAYQRPSKSYEKGAYPEQGEVGPVIPYPENRPRRLDVPKTEPTQEPPGPT
ncbi:MAG: hypothetical protein GEU78_07395 [Actinobacteria bacterium]|nr:hypothetical protein [Actinomycetota bacterium]